MSLSIAGMSPLAFGKRIFKEFSDDDLSGLAAELSYRFFLSIFPFVIFLAAVGGLIANGIDVDNPAQKFVDMFGDRLPDDAASVLQGQVDSVVKGPSTSLLTIGLLGTFWAAAGGVGSLIKAMNRAYDVPETRPFWKRIGLALGLTGLAGVAIIVSLVLMIGGQIAAGDLADRAGLGDPFAYFIGFARIVLVAIFIAIAAAFLYWASPNIALPFKWITPGAILFTAGWLVLTVGFAFYVSNFSSYNKTYGALGGVVVLLIWFYLTSLVLLLGAEVNAVVDEVESGPVLAQRRELAARKLAERRKDRPSTPEAVGAPVGPPGSTGSSQRDGRAPRNTPALSPLTAALGALIALVAVTCRPASAGGATNAAIAQPAPWPGRPRTITPHGRKP